EDQGCTTSSKLTQRDNNIFCAGGIAQIVRRWKADQRKYVGKQAILRVDQDDIGEGQRKRRNNGWHVDGGAIDANLFDVAVHGYGENNRHYDADWHGKDRIIQRVIERLPEQVVGKHALIILQTEPDRRLKS